MVRVPNRGSVRFLNLKIHFVNGEIFGTEKRWSVFRDGLVCEAVRYRVSTVVALVSEKYLQQYHCRPTCKLGRTFMHVLFSANKLVERHQTYRFPSADFHFEMCSCC